MHSTHLDQDWGNSESAEVGRKEGNVLFKDALNTFYFRLYGIGHMVKDHLDSKIGKCEIKII